MLRIARPGMTIRIQKSGFDATAYWARSGLMDMIRPEESTRPMRTVGGIGDSNEIWCTVLVQP